MSAKKKSEAETRPSIETNTRIAVWAAAAGRCTFCNAYILENEDLGEVIPVGELAHNVGWSEDSPRGEATEEVDRSHRDNLLLLCRNCHKPIDQKGVVGRYPVEKLRALKLDHERRIREFTAVGGDKKAIVLRLVGDIRNVPPELTYDTVLDAVVGSGLFPKLLPRAHRAEVEIDLRGYSRAGTPEYFHECARQIDEKVAAAHDGVRQNEATRFAVFAFARVPLLIHLGARLDDKVSALIFQRRRLDGVNPWRWPEVDEDDTPLFKVETLQEGSDPLKVAVLFNISGTVGLEDLPASVDTAHTIYVVTVNEPFETHPNLIASPAALGNFENTVRKLLALIERGHGKLSSIDVFPALPISCAVTLGRVLMPDVSPALKVFDRDEENKFFEALEVRR